MVSIPPPSSGSVKIIEKRADWACRSSAAASGAIAGRPLDEQVQAIVKAYETELLSLMREVQSQDPLGVLRGSGQYRHYSRGLRCAAPRI